MEEEAEKRRRSMLSVAGATGVIAIVAVVALQRPPEPPTKPTPGRVQLSWFEKRTVKNAVRERLKDPGSAEFGSIYARQTEHEWIDVCGFVSARNSFGGMTGMQPFQTSIYSNGKASVVWISDRRDVAALCRHEELFGDEMADFLSR